MYVPAGLLSQDAVVADGAQVVPHGGAGTAAKRIANVASFGGMPNARFYDAADGRWYQDQKFSREATDDAGKLQAAINYAAAHGIGTVYLPAGNWYFKAKHGSHNEFVRLSTGNVTIRGDGPATRIFVAPGINAAGGYSCVIGNADGAFTGAPVQLDNVRVTGILFDHNARFNQWGGPNYNGMSGDASLEAAVCVVQGDRITYDHLTVQNHNGTFALVAGTYGGDRSRYLARNVLVDACSLRDIGADPGTGDSSAVATGADHQIVRGCRVSQTVMSVTGASDNGAGLVRLRVTTTAGMFSGMSTFVQGVRGTTEANDSWVITVVDSAHVDLQGSSFAHSYTGGGTLEPFRANTTPFELHGNDVTFTGNTVEGMHRLLNMGGDSLDCSNYEIAGNTALHCGLGVTMYSYRGFKCRGIRVTGNTFGLIKDVPIGSEVVWGGALNTVPGDGFAIPYGAGFFDVTVADNIVYWADRQNDPPASLGGFVFTGNTGGGYFGGGLTIRDNRIRGLGFGIAIRVGRQANTGNLLEDVKVVHNLIEDSGSYGITINGGSNDAAPQFTRLRVLDNRIRNVHGKNQFGVLVTGYTDDSSVVQRNDASNATQAAEFFDPTNYPSASSPVRSPRRSCPPPADPARAAPPDRAR
jgi:hypothetical protein